jgi:hypothetical protein
MHTASDIRVPIVQAGAPRIGIGPEWVDLADYLRTIAVTSRAVVGLCG